MEEFLSHAYISLFIIIAFGMIIGRVKFFGFSFDISAVIFVALFMGHYGVIIPENFMKIGLLLFIFTIGLQAGPGFFEAFKKYGRALIITTLFSLFGATFFLILLTKLFDIDTNLAIGVFNGALTSTPGLAAAIESTNSPLAPVGYGIAYTFGVVGVILLVNFLPKIFNVNLDDEELEFEEGLKSEHPDIKGINLIVENPNIDGKKISQLNIKNMAEVVISKIMHNNIVYPISKNSILQTGDIVRVIGCDTETDKAKVLIGNETNIKFPPSQKFATEWVLISNKKVVNKRYSEVGLGRNYDANVLKIKRSGIELSPRSSSQFKYGDKVQITGENSSLNAVKRILGDDAKKLSHTDFLPIALGIIIGVLLGNIDIPLGNFTLNLGMTGGTLASGILLSRLGKTGPIVWSMSGSANQLLREFGLLLFMAAVGTKAGTTFVSTIKEFGFELIFIGIVLTIAPVIIGAFVGRIFFKMNFLSLLGVITGAMTSTPGLAAINSKSDSNAAPIAYATVYPVALVYIIIISQILPKIL